MKLLHAFLLLVLACAGSTVPAVSPAVETRGSSGTSESRQPTYKAVELSEFERRMVAWVDEHRADHEAALEEIVNINSGTMNLDGVGRVGRWYQQRFEKLGMKTEWITLPKSMRRAGHLVASTTANDGPRMLLIGHLDTVFPKDSKFQRFKRKGDLAHGPGTVDMKGGNNVVLHALQALHHAGVLHDLAITVIFTGDEEKPGHPLADTRAKLIEAAKRADYALGFESLVDHLDTATIARRGFTSWNLAVAGKRGHSSQIHGKEYGAGAIYEAARIIEMFRNALADEATLTVSPGRILGGTEVNNDLELDRGTAAGKRNVIPQVVEVVGDIRALDPEQLARAKETMMKIAKENLPHTSATLSFEDGYPPMAPTKENRALLRRLSQVNVDLGRQPIEAVHPLRRGAADISFAAPHVPAMDGLGLLGSGDHSPEESVDLRSLPWATKRAALLVYRLCKP